MAIYILLLREKPTHGNFFENINEIINETINETINENLAFFSIFGGVLRTAAKNRKKCLMKSYRKVIVFKRRYGYSLKDACPKYSKIPYVLKSLRSGN